MMQPHPFRESFSKKISGSLLVLLAISIQTGMLSIYTGLSTQIALTDSVITIGLLAMAGYFMWYMIAFVRIWQAHVLITVLLLVVNLGISFTIFSFLGVRDTAVFLLSVPLRLLISISGWIILLQWYWLLQKGEKPETGKVHQSGTDEHVRGEVLDRISVKDGTRIHIIHLNELYCIQASGDYVTLFTDSGQHVKEQTMKYFEAHLPAETFVRIHRSSIVNTEYLLRVELFGKESYQVRLKNGMNLRASNTGYKLLRERLAL